MLPSITEVDKQVPFHRGPLLPCLAWLPGASDELYVTRLTDCLNMFL